MISVDIPDGEAERTLKLSPLNYLKYPEPTLTIVALIKWINIKV